MLTSVNDWNTQWEKWFTRYAQGNPRLGKWLGTTYPAAEGKILEIGAGSARDSRFLASTAQSVTCVDFSPEVVRLLVNSQPPENMTFFQADAANLPFPERAFDVTFHKGVWVLFSDNAILKSFLREQLRVTNRVALAIVQNARNTARVAETQARAAEDPLFNIRFFDPAELADLGRDVVADMGIHAKLRIVKYGNPSLSQYLAPLGALGDWFAAKLYALLPWSCVECVVLEIDRPEAVNAK